MGGGGTPSGNAAVLTILPSHVGDHREWSYAVILKVTRVGIRRTLIWAKTSISQGNGWEETNREEPEINCMSVHPVPCPLHPPPASPPSSNSTRLPLRGWKKGERPLKRDLYLSQQINQTLLACTRTARTCPSSAVCRHGLCSKSDADGGNAGNRLPHPSTRHCFWKLQKDTVANRIRTCSAIEEEKGQMSDV